MFQSGVDLPALYSAKASLTSTGVGCKLLVPARMLVFDEPLAKSRESLGIKALNLLFDDFEFAHVGLVRRKQKEILTALRKSAILDKSDCVH